jgi:hypothetical protein
MSALVRRRHFLKTTATTGALWAFGDLSFLSQLPPISRADARLDPKAVRLQPEIEPLVRLLEETPREAVAGESGCAHQAGFELSGATGGIVVGWRPLTFSRGPLVSSFTQVLVVNSAHLASIASPDTERWLPIFWALDYFKESQARDVREGDWTMAPVNESAVPPAAKARQAFTEAMDNWDEAAADAAVAGLVRTSRQGDLFEVFCRYGARDFRDIGHKAIYVANSWRTLQHIGWQHAEPVLRSLGVRVAVSRGRESFQA